MELLYNGWFGVTAKPGIIAFEAVKKVFDRCGIESPRHVIYNADTYKRGKNTPLAESYFLVDKDTGEVLIVVEHDQVIWTIKDLDTILKVNL